MDRAAVTGNTLFFLRKHRTSNTERPMEGPLRFCNSMFGVRCSEIDLSRYTAHRF